MPHVKIIELLPEVDRWTCFTRHFTHLKTGDAARDKTPLLTTILADAINLGLTKMAECCPGASYARLSWLQAWHIRQVLCNRGANNSRGLRVKLFAMPHYRVHRLKEGQRENFRWAAHTGGLAIAKLKDYEVAEEASARNPYELWRAMKGEENALRPGDLVEAYDADEQGDTESGSLCIFKYVGFEPAQWFVPEVRTSELVSAPSGFSEEIGSNL